MIEEIDEPVDHTEFDGPLEELLIKRAGKAEDLLATVLHFLARKTRVLSTPDGRRKAHELLAEHAGPAPAGGAISGAAAAGKSDTGKKGAGLQTGFFGKSAPVASPASRRDTPAEAKATAATDESKVQELLKQVVSQPLEVGPAPAAGAAAGAPDAVPSGSGSGAASAAAAAAAPAAAAAAAGPSSSFVPTGDQQGAEGDGDEEEGAEEAPKGLKPTPGNGYDYGRYAFSQTLAEVTVVIPVPPGTKGRMVDVTISRSKLKAGLKGQPPIIDAQLTAPVKPDDSSWMVADGDTVEITLAKVDKMAWWKAVVEGDPEINLQQVEPENSKLTDLDGETRATVEKMMWDQRQKQLGLPTSEEAQRQEMLKKFMSQHPEMDFSNAKFM